MTEQKLTTMEQLLAAVAADEAFRVELLADRQAALRSRGIELNRTDAAMLASVPDAQLVAMLDQLAVGQVVSPEEMLCSSAGVRPDDVRATSLGIRPSPVKGIRPGRILLTAAAGTALVGGVMSLTAVKGSRPDRPAKVMQPLQQQDDGGAAPPDAGVDSGDKDR